MPAPTLIEQVRLNVGDTDPEFPLLPDDTYQWLLDKYEDNVNRSALDAARFLLFELSRYPTRERSGQIEVWNEWANTYRKALELFLKDPNLNTIVAVPYAGGISKSDMKSNDTNNDNVRPAFYSHFGSGRRVYNHNNDTCDERVDLGPYDYRD